METGWIKLHNKFLKWEWYSEPNMVAFWIHLLLGANWQDKNWKGQPIKRGQLVVGRKKLAKQTGLSEQQVRLCLTRLKTTNEITIKATNKYSVITIVKWEEYQSKRKKQPAIQPATQPTNNQQTTTTKDNKEYKDIYISIPPKIEDVKKYCLERNNGVDFNKWFDFYSAKDWFIGKNKMKDWRAAVRTWEQNKKQGKWN